MNELSAEGMRNPGAAIAEEAWRARSESMLSGERQELPVTSFRFRALPELRASLSGPSYLIKPILERDATTVMYGESGTFKTFLGVDLGLSIATGCDYHGMKTHRGAVFFLVGEGMGGYGRRIEGWLRDRGIDHADVYVSEIPAALASEEQAMAVGAAVAELAARHRVEPVLIVIDTLSANFGAGDESSNADISALLRNLAIHIREPFRAAILLIHHVGHGEKGRERGASAIRANVDARIHVERIEGDECAIRCKKVKDGAEWPPLQFRPRVVKLPGVYDSEGEISTTLVLDRVSCSVANEPAPALGKAQAALLGLLQTLYEERAEKEKTCPPVVDPRVTMQEWRDANKARQAVAANNFNRTAKSLSSAGLVSEEQGFVLLTEAGDVHRED